MSYSMTLKVGAATGGISIDKEIAVSASAHMGVDEDIPIQEDYQIAFDLDISEIAGIIIVSDQDITLETNDGTTPDDTLNLKADTPVMFCADPAFGSNPFTTDTTDLYATNASAAVARLQVEVLFDSTP